MNWNQYYQKNRQAMHKELLRGALCAVWLFGAVFTALKFFAWSVSEYGSANASLYAWQTGICFVVVVVAAIAHAYLIHEESKNV